MRWDNYRACMKSRVHITVHVHSPFDLPERNIITSHFCAVSRIFKHTPATAQQPLFGQSLLIIETSRSHTDTPHPVGLLWTSDRPDAAHNTHKKQTSTPLVGFETTIPENKRPDTHALDHVATGMGPYFILPILILSTYIITIYTRCSFYLALMSICYTHIGYNYV
jgi:hypothetical protein